MLDDAATVWDISSLQTQTEAIQLSSLNPNCFQDFIGLFDIIDFFKITLSKFSFITSSNPINPPKTLNSLLVNSEQLTTLPLTFNIHFIIDLY